MKNKVFLVLFACILLFSLVTISCASSTPATSSSAAASKTTTSAPPAQTSAAPASTQAPATTALSTNVIKLRFANYFPPTSDQGVLWGDFCKEIEKRSNGQVQITYYPGGTLFDGPSTPDSIRTGIADIGYMTTGHVPGRFPVSEAITSMNGFPSAFVVSHVADDFYTQFKPKEWDAYKVLVGNGNSPMVIFSNKPINVMADYKGTKCRVLGKQADQAKLLGAAPVNIPVGDSFDALSKGVIDNTATSMEAAKTWRIAEVCKYCTLTWPVFSPPSYYTIMNKDSYNNLPANIKTIVDQVSTEWADKDALMSNNVDVVGAQYANQMGMKFIDLSNNEAAKWQAAVAPVTDQYVTDMVGKGYSKQEIQSWIDYIKARTDYWLKQQATRGVKSPMGPPEIKG